jgi:hypothetical protein
MGMIKKIIFSMALGLAFNSSIVSQRVYQYEESLQEGQVILTDTIAIPYEKAGYTLLLPDGNPDGLVVFFNANRTPLRYNNEPNFEFYALKNNLGVLYVTTGNSLEFFFDKGKMLQIMNYVTKAIKEYSLPKENIFFAGMSLAGTRALKFAKYLLSTEFTVEIKPKAIAICDSPLDFVRFWKEEIEARDLNFQSSAANEGAWVSGYLEKNLGGTPLNSLENYIDYSPYCYISDNRGLIVFKDIPIRAYSEPDVKWWMKTRRKDYYEMNVIDLAAFINELNKLGNNKAELILTKDKGYLPDGTRHPHSWSIVDNKELVNWFLSFCKN